MTIISDKAIKNHYLNHNCAQSVVMAFADELNIDKDLLFKISEGFGFGMGCQSICGAASAMVAIISLKNSSGLADPGTSKKKTYEITKIYLEKFQRESKSLMCSDIKGDKKVCDRYIELAAKLAEEFLHENS